MFILIKTAPLIDTQEMKNAFRNYSRQSSHNPEEPFLLGAQSVCGCCIFTAKPLAAST